MKTFKNMAALLLCAFSAMPVMAQQTYEEMEQLTVNEQVTTVITATEPVRFVDISTDKVTKEFLRFWKPWIQHPDTRRRFYGTLRFADGNISFQRNVRCCRVLVVSRFRSRNFCRPGTFGTSILANTKNTLETICRIRRFTTFNEYN